MTLRETDEPATIAGHPLDNPVWAALTGPHRPLAEIRGGAARYPADVSPFVGLVDGPGAPPWADLAALAGPGGLVAVTGSGLRAPFPAGWEITMDLPGVQMVDEGMATGPDPEARPLGPADVPEMLDLVARTRPGPFLPRTIAMGTYLGIRREGTLIAMAGERLRPPGWTEISAVCTDDAYRGQGLATRLMRAVAAGIRARGDVPFLHAAATNTTAIRLYEALGFTVRRRTAFVAARVPGPGGPA